MVNSRCMFGGIIISEWMRGCPSRAREPSGPKISQALSNSSTPWNPVWSFSGTLATRGLQWTTHWPRNTCPSFTNWTTGSRFGSLGFWNPFGTARAETTKRWAVREFLRVYRVSQPAREIGLSKVSEVGMPYGSRNPQGRSLLGCDPGGTSLFR